MLASLPPKDDRCDDSCNYYCIVNITQGSDMKVGIIGVGGVGSACGMALVMRNSARDIVLIDRTQQRAKAVATDIQYGAPLSGMINIVDGDYADLAGAAVVMITAGINEKTGGATDRHDTTGRLKLLQTNATLYKDIVKQIIAVAPQAVMLIVTDPPDPLADLTRLLAPQSKVLSTGTYLDSLRFRFHLARYFNVHPSYVDANVLGEHGTSEVFLWSSASIGGTLLSDLLKQKGQDFKAFKQQIENEVRFANITIIEGNNASQYGIGMVSARITEAVLRDERIVIPLGSYQEKYGITLSLPSVVGAKGVTDVFEPAMDKDESLALQHSADVLKQAFTSIENL